MNEPDCENDIHELRKLTHNFSWEVLITTYNFNEYEGCFEIFALKPPGSEVAKKIFKHYLGQESFDQESERQIEELVEFVDNLPLMVELMAKTIKNSDIHNSPHKLLASLKSKGLKPISRETVKLKQSIRDKRIIEILREVFNISDLKEDEEKLLSQLAILGMTTFENLSFSLGIQNEDDSYDLSDRLKSLLRKGWVSKSDRPDSTNGEKVISMNDIFRKIVLMQIPPTQSNCSVLLEYLGGKIYRKMEADDSSWYTYKSFRKLMEELANNIEKYGDDSLECPNLTCLYHSLSYLAYILDDNYDEKDDEKNAKYYIEKCVPMAEKLAGKGVIDKDDLRLARYYNLYSLILSDESNFKDAVLFQEKALNIRAQYSRTQPHAESLLNLGILYYESKVKPVGQAIELIKESIKISEKLYPDGHPHLCNAYFNIIAIYFAEEKDEGEITFYLKKLEPILSSYDENHPDLGLIYLILAYYYTGKENYIKAREFWKKAIDFREDSLFGKKDWDSIIFNYSDFLFYFNVEHEELDLIADFIKARNLLQDALVVYKEEHDLWHVFLSCIYLGRIHKRLGNVTGFEKFLRDANQLRNETQFNVYPEYEEQIILLGELLEEVNSDL